MRIPQPQPKKAHVREGILYVPKTSIAIDEFDTPNRGTFNWKSISERSEHLLHLTCTAIRNRTLKKFVRIARANGVQWKDSGVVYVVCITSSQDYYIGRTEGTALDRLKKHTYSRYSEKGSELSHYFANRIFNHTDGEAIFHRCVVVLPIFKATDKEGLIEAEESYINRFKGPHMLNTNDVFFRHRSRNRHNRKLRRGFESIGHSNAAPKPNRQREEQLLARINELSRTDNGVNNEAQKLLKSLGKRRLRILNRDALLAKAPSTACIKKEIERRQHTAANQKPSAFIRVNFTRYVSSRSLRSLIFTKLFPFPEIVHDVRVCVSLNRTLGQMAINAASLAIKGREEYHCLCEKLQNDGVLSKHFRGGHLATNDITAVFSHLQIEEGDVAEELEVLWHQGSKFRSALNINESASIFHQNLQAFIDPILDDVPLSQRTEKMAAVKEWLADCGERFRLACNDPRNYIVKEKTLKAIRSLGKDFVITVVDKNPQSLAILCMREYMQRLQARMASTDFKQIPADNVEGILKSHREASVKYGCKPVDSLPYLYIVPKLHKEPSRPYDRFIAGNSALNVLSKDTPTPARQAGRGVIKRKPVSSTTQIGRKVSDFLNAIIDLLLIEDKAGMMLGRPRCFWVIRDVSEAVPLFKQSATIYTRDFSTMYQNFPIDDLFAGVSSEATLALKFAARRFFNARESDYAKLVFSRKAGQKHGSWRMGTPNPKTDWGINECLEALQFLLHNTIYSNVFGVVQQVIGVPMGGPASGPASNLGLAAAERRFVLRCVAEEGAAVIKVIYNNFHIYCRYIDDMSSQFNEVPTKEDYYGMELVETGQVPPDNATDFLCFTFSARPGLHLDVSFKNKQEKFPLLLVRFPGSISTISDSSRIGCIIGGLVNIFRLIDNTARFAQAIRDFFEIIEARNFTFNIVRTGITRFLNGYCKHRFKGFMMLHFFAPILARWPNHNIPNGDVAVQFEYLRQRSYLHAPHSFRPTFATPIIAPPPILDIRQFPHLQQSQQQQFPHLQQTQHQQTFAIVASPSSPPSDVSFYSFSNDASESPEQHFGPLDFL